MHLKRVGLVGLRTEHTLLAFSLAVLYNTQIPVQSVFASNAYIRDAIDGERAEVSQIEKHGKARNVISCLL